MVAAGSVVAAVQGLRLAGSGSVLSYHRLTRFLSKVIKCDPVSDLTAPGDLPAPTRHPAPGHRGPSSPTGTAAASARAPKMPGGVTWGGQRPEFRGTGPVTGQPCARITHLSWGPLQRNGHLLDLKTGQEGSHRPWRPPGRRGPRSPPRQVPAPTGCGSGPRAMPGPQCGATLNRCFKGPCGARGGDNGGQPCFDGPSEAAAAKVRWIVLSLKTPLSHSHFLAFLKELK